MTWILAVEDRHVALADGQRLGRADFPLDPTLSRNHLEVSIRPDGLFVRDPGSNNGVVRDGERFPANEFVFLAEGDRITIGATTLTVRRAAGRLVDARRLATYTPPGCFAVLAGAALLRPSLDFGAALGTPLLVGFVGGLFALCLAASALWAHLLGGLTTTVPVATLRIAATLFTAGGSAASLLTFADRHTGLRTYAAQTRIAYFCDEHFDHGRCVDNVNACPECALKIERYKRARMAARLKASSDAYEAHLRQLDPGVTVRQPARATEP